MKAAGKKITIGATILLILGTSLAWIIPAEPEWSVEWDSSVPMLMETIDSIPCGFGNDTLLIRKKAALELNAHVLDLQDTFSSRIFGRDFLLRTTDRDTQMLYRSWYGNIVGIPDSYFIFTKSADLLSGIIVFDSVTYSIKQCRPGLYGLAELKNITIPDDSIDIATENEMVGISQCNVLFNQPLYDIDIALFYTTDALHAAAEEAGIAAGDTFGAKMVIEAEIKQAMEIANQAFDEANLPARLHLAYLHSTGVDGALLDKPNMDLDAKLELFQQVPTVVKIRNDYHIDLISLFVEQCNLNYIGYANPYNGGGTGISADYANFVVCRKYASTYATFLHELGHVLGLGHYCGQGEPRGNPYRYGCFETVMGQHPLFIRRARFSDASQGRGTAVLGTNGCASDDVSVLRSSVMYASNYRCGGTAENVWIADSYIDMGDEPFYPKPFTIASLLNSPNIWGQRKPDHNLTSMYIHENPNRNAKKFYIYTKVKNGSFEYETGLLKVYYQPASLIWSPCQSPRFATTKDSVRIPPRSTIVYEVELEDVFNVEHYSFAVEWIASDDTLKMSKCDSLMVYAAENNNIAIKNHATVLLNPQSGLAMKTNAHLTKDTVEIIFEAMPDCKLGFEDSIPFIKDGGKIRVWFDTTGIDHELLDGINLDPYEFPGRITRVSKSTCDFQFPRWTGSAKNGMPHKLKIEFDVGIIGAPKEYEIVLWQYANVRIGGRPNKILGAFTYRIVVESGIVPE